MANKQFPMNASVQFDGASPPISQASQIARGFYKDAEVANAPIQQSMTQYPANFACQSSIGKRDLNKYSPYCPSAVPPSWPRQSTPSAPYNAVTQTAITNSIQEHVYEDLDTTSQEMNTSESVAGLTQGLTGLSLDPSKRELVQPQESTSLAAALSAADSDSGCVQSSGSLPLATAPNCADDRSGSAVESGYVSSSSGSGSLAAAMPDAKIEMRIVLCIEKLEALYLKRNVTRKAVAERAASIDLFYGVDEDKDTQLHICLYDFKQYSSEAWNLVAGSRPDWLSIKNNRGFTPLMCAVMYGADVDMVRALSLLSFSLTFADLRGYTALHYAAHLGRLDLVDAMLFEPTQHEHLLVRVFYRDELFAGPQQELSYPDLLARHRAAVATLLASRNAAGETPLYCAVKSSNFEVTARLLAMRADPRIEVHPLVFLSLLTLFAISYE